MSTTPTAAAHETSDLPTKREWLAKQGLAVSLEEQRAAGKRGGGRFSKVANERIQAELAKPDGQRFSD